MTHRAILTRLADGHDSAACSWCKANRLGVWS